MTKRLNHSASMPNLRKDAPTFTDRNPPAVPYGFAYADPSLPALPLAHPKATVSERPAPFRFASVGQESSIGEGAGHLRDALAGGSACSYDLSVIDLYHDAVSSGTGDRSPVRPLRGPTDTPSTPLFAQARDRAEQRRASPVNSWMSDSPMASPAPRLHQTYQLSLLLVALSDDPTDFDFNGPSGPSQDISHKNYPENLSTSHKNHPGNLSTSHSAASLLSSRESAHIIRNAIELSKTSLHASRDRYGFRKQSAWVTEASYNTWWADYSKYLIRRKRKWEVLLKQNGLVWENDNPQRFPARSQKVKRYVRKGIPAEWRGHAWFYYAHGHEKLAQNVGVYDALVAATAGLRNKDTEIIERDLHRTFPDNVHFKTEAPEASETPLVEALRRVLVAFSQHMPAIGYCQSLNFLAGMLLIFMDEERAFWMLVIITQKYLPEVHGLNLEGVNVDQGVLMLCLQQYLPSMWSRVGVDLDGARLSEGSFLVRLPPVTLCTASWFMSGFVGVLPIETVLRVWDCIFYEESKTLFRVSVALFDMVEPEVAKISDQMEIFQAIQNFPKKLINPNELFDHCFKRRSGIGHYLSQEEVDKCRQFVATQRRNHTETTRLGHRDGLYDFEHPRGLSGAVWNRTLTMRMRRRRAKVLP